MGEKGILRAIIDDREKKLMKVFDKRKGDARILEYEAKRLSVADIVVSERVGIERKEGFDFVSSIMDNRLFEQLLRLKEAYPEGAIIILEGLNDDVFENTGMKITSIYGALSFISLGRMSPRASSNPSTKCLSNSGCGCNVRMRLSYAKAACLQKLVLPTVLAESGGSIT